MSVRQDALIAELRRCDGSAVTGYLMERPAVKAVFGIGYYERARQIHRSIYSTLRTMERNGIVRRIPNEQSRTEALFQLTEKDTDMSTYEAHGTTICSQSGNALAECDTGNNTGREREHARTLATGGNLVPRFEEMIKTLEAQAALHQERADPDKGDECFWQVTATRNLEIAQSMRDMLADARDEAHA